MTTQRGQSWLLADRGILDPDDRVSQQLLALAHARQTRPLGHLPPNTQPQGQDN
ncbi:hypothetical protein ACVW00_004389 [Marmoricola sp. URHA0025 HA25]